MGPFFQMPQNSFYFKSPARIHRLGKYLKQLREELGLSMHAVARKSDLTPSYISKIEAGTALKSISVEALINFSGTYNIPVTAILEEAGFLEKSNDGLPDFITYLKIKYKLPHQAIRDLEIAKEIIEIKYNKK